MHQISTSLRCSFCARTYSSGDLLNVCECGKPLLVEYDLAAFRSSFRDSATAVPEPSANSMPVANPQFTWIDAARADMWRYAAVLPAAVAEAVTLGEGWTPLIHLHRLGARLKADDLWLKDEGLNPTGSFKARGLSAAVTMAKKFGVKKIAIPSAGNAASALAAYAAAAGIEAHIFMPDDVPQSNFIECKAYGAHVTLVAGMISDCGRIVAERKLREGWFEVSTLKEPYRIEGKKTMGYELAEQLDWALPDAILYPCGGGVGLIGMWKAFSELEKLGVIGSRRPRMVAVQAEGCQPIANAFNRGAAESEFFKDAHTVASGLRVPKPLGDFLILQAIRESQGTVISISDEEMIDAAVLLAQEEGVFAAPEGGACVAAVGRLLASGFLKPTDRTVIYNTGSGLKYLEAYTARFPRFAAREQDKLGGLITPR